MGTWGIHSFENDCALDWVDTKLAKQGEAAISAAMQAVLDAKTEDSLDADTAQIGLAAVAALAAAMGRGRVQEKEALRDLPKIDTTTVEDLVSQANYVIMSVTGGSDLRDLWEEADWEERDAWISALTDLRSRVNGEIKAATSDTSAPDVAAELSLEDIRLAINGLESRIEEVRHEVIEGLARIARKVESLSP